MFTLEEKQYLLSLLKQKRRFFMFKQTPKIHNQLIEKLEQMIRNETINRQ